MKYLLLFLLISSQAFAQSAVQQTIKKSIVVNKKALYADALKKKSFIFYLGLRVNEKGQVDSVFHSNSDLFSTKITDVNTMVKKLKREKTAFKAYKDQVLITLIHLKRADDNTLQLSADFSEAFKSATAYASEQIKNRKVTYIDASLIVM